MSLFRIALRSILQRGVASLLTMFSMALGVMLVVAVLSIHGVVSQSFKNNASLGYNMIVGAKGGQEQLVLNTVFYLSKPVENISYTYYLEFLKRNERDRLQADSLAAHCRTALDEAMDMGGDGLANIAIQPMLARVGMALVPDTRMKSHHPPVETGREGKYGLMTDLAIPLCLGDYFGRFRVVGTTPLLFDELVYDIDNNRKYEFAQGRNFHWHDKEHGYFEAVVGATVARELNVTLGQEISPAHGDPEGHKHTQQFTVVGILRPSGTPNDRAVFVNMEGFYLMEDHAMPISEAAPAAGDEPKAIDEQTWRAMQKSQSAAKKAAWDKTARREPLPVEQREITALLLKVPYQFAPGLENAINEGTQAQAVLPVAVIYGLFEFIVNPIEWTLLLLTAMICVVSGISILVSIYNSMSERRGEIAVMRALGAGRGTVMSIILLEATLLALGGGFLGWFCGHTGCWAMSPWVEDRTGVQVGFGMLEPSVSLLKLFGATSDAAERFRIPLESVLLPLLVFLAILVGIWPAISAYRTDVAKSLGK